MGSPIFDATFGTGRFRHEEPMTTTSDLMRVRKLEQEIAELTPEQRAVFDAKLKARNDAAKIALSQSDAEPVAWRSNLNSGERWFIDDPLVAQDWQNNGWGAEPLYTAPPRPDASGLIEAAEKRGLEEALAIVEEYDCRNKDQAGMAVGLTREIRNRLSRSRASDRSGK